ncbi:hypothetical protein [Candidatus Phytoplasma phoenicium]|uniref:ABC transporter substrate-binding protein n=1 Tax=Candidatus Phytoplasma phoenicium TaxID=198422 RepID=A0A0L0MK82_9MOLU|nr:hypothetical protein [Candidatus Phytoplasma phoenicium]KND62666.1 hypothetical protein AlmWB_01390 [Candidatus Phytoplasma phoenicium]
MFKLNQKIIIVVITSFLVFSILGYNFYQKIPTKHVLLTTPIISIKQLLEQIPIKKFKQNNLSPKIEFYSNNYVSAINAVSEKRADATLCCHMPYILENHLNHKSWENIQIVQPFYVGKFGIFATDSFDINTKSNIIITILSNPSNERLAYYYLYKLSKKFPDTFGQKFKMKTETEALLKQDPNTQNHDFLQLFKLKKEHFEMTGLTIKKVGLTQIGNIPETETDLIISFPALMSISPFKYLENLNISESEVFEDKFLTVHAISLMTHKDHQNDKSIELVKEGLRSSEIFEFYKQQATNDKFLIPIDKIEPIRKSIVLLQKHWSQIVSEE